MLTVSRMKSFLNLSPTLYSNVTTPFPRHFHSGQCIILRETSRRMLAAKSLQSPDFLSRISVMHSLVNCAKPSNCNRIRSLHAEAASRSGEIHVIVGPMFAGKTTTLLRRIKLESSNGSFQANTIKTSIHLDKTLKGLCLTGRVSDAIGILCRTGVKVESGTYSLLLQECIFRKAYKKGRRIHWQMTVAGFVPDEYLKVKLMILYAKAGDLDTAHILFDNLLVKTLISWNAMIAGYVQKGTEEVGLGFYFQMRQCGLIPDQYTFASVFRACASLAILEQGKQAHAVLIKSQISENIVVTSALMDMYFKCSSLCDGFQVFDNSLDRNIITWTALISGYGQHGKVFEVLDFFHQMINEGFQPNQITFLAVLTSCSHAGLVDEGQEYFSSMMRDYGVQPRGKHYAAIVDLLGRAGRLIEAYEFVKNSPCKEHPAIWGALLGACKIHGNVDMIKLAAKKFFELEPENAGKYIVLSNAYATFGLWNNVAEIRSIMKESGIKKEPGYSMIEVQAEAHFFFMGPNIHKQTEQIYELVKDMACILKDTGDVPDLSVEELHSFTIVMK